MLSAAVLALSLAACSSSNTDESGMTSSVGGAPAVSTTLVGPGCADFLAQVPAGAGSIEVMAQEPVGTAIANNSLLMTSYVVPGRLAPDGVVGTHTTVQGGELTVTESADAIVVLGARSGPTAPDGSQIPNQAGVICGGIETENGTVYLIDQVLAALVACPGTLISGWGALHDPTKSNPFRHRLGRGTQLPLRARTRELGITKSS